MAKVSSFVTNQKLCNRSWPGQMGSCDHPEITFRECFAQQMTLWVYSSVTYIVCVLDSEGQWMSLKSLLIVEHFFFFFVYRKGSFAKCCTIISMTQILHILGSNSAKMWNIVTTLRLFLQGRSKTGSAPHPQQTLQNVNLIFYQPAQLELDRGVCAVRMQSNSWQSRAVDVLCVLA